MIPDSPPTGARRQPRRLREPIVTLKPAGEARALPVAGAANAPAARSTTIAEMFADPQTIARGMRIDLDDGHGNVIPSVRAPMLMSETPLQSMSAPRRGSASTREEILAELERGRKTNERPADNSIVDALEANGVERIFACPVRAISPCSTRCTTRSRNIVCRQEGGCCDDGRLPGQAHRQARHLLRHPRPRRHQRLGRHSHRRRIRPDDPLHRPDRRGMPGARGVPGGRLQARFRLDRQMGGRDRRSRRIPNSSRAPLPSPPPAGPARS
jgi:hypothetical protein